MSKSKDSFKVIHANATADMAETIGVDKDLCDEVRARGQSVYEISLNDNTFLVMKRDFDRLLNDMLSDMLAHGNGEGNIAVNVKVELEKSRVDANGNTLPATITKPKFTHKVISLVKHKEDAEGMVGGEYELALDPETNQYIMRKIKSAQTDLFDSEDAVE
ncbi:MAG: hypothetical protein FWB85_02710 [Chitinispirillia bacterium]|nr:hypothetical protein [Chitinispirillia bacterium]MCL2241335.1 hypothetical protein [Chitinispirillia bacterium]